MMSVACTHGCLAAYALSTGMRSSMPLLMP